MVKIDNLYKLQIYYSSFLFAYIFSDIKSRIRNWFENGRANGYFLLRALDSHIKIKQ